MQATATANEIGDLLEADVASFTIPSQLEWIGKASNFLCQRSRQCGVCDASRADMLALALHEALTNAVVHGNLGISSELKEQPDDAFARALVERSADPMLSKREVTIHFRFDGVECHITIHDQGNGFDYASWLKRLEQDGDEPSLACSGRGILMIRSLVDQAEYSDGGRQIDLILRARSAGERRRSDRRAWRELVRIMPSLPDGEADFSAAQEAICRDVSHGGMALIQQGSNIPSRIIVEMNRNGRVVSIPAEVCHITNLKGGLVQIGCRFRHVQATHETPQSPAPQVVLKLLDNLEHKAIEHERRAQQRVPYTVTVQIRAGDGKFRTAFSRDLSHGGIAVVTAFELPLGQSEVALPIAGEPDQIIQVQIVRCQRVTEGVYDIGCRFA